MSWVSNLGNVSRMAGDNPPWKNDSFLPHPLVEIGFLHVGSIFCDATITFSPMVWGTVQKIVRLNSFPTPIHFRKQQEDMWGDKEWVEVANPLSEHELKATPEASSNIGLHLLEFGKNALEKEILSLIDIVFFVLEQVPEGQEPVFAYCSMKGTHIPYLRDCLLGKEQFVLFEKVNTLLAGEGQPGNFRALYNESFCFAEHAVSIVLS